MDVSYNWLKSLIDFEIEPHDLAERLTMSGHAVEEMSRPGEGLEDVVVARVTAVREHPGADRLRLAEVDCGAAEPVVVVCGAPNVAEGGTYPLAPEGAVLAGGFKVEKVKIRGVESRGMLCSERELGLSDEASGLMELPGSLEPGAPLAEALGLDDWRLTLEVTANRGDMWSHLGAAREIQPFCGNKLTLPPSQPEETGPAVDTLTSVTLEDPEGCPRYMARVITGVKVGPSPDWLVRRLESVGQRSINNVVDVSNFILLELGQPLHAFDLDKLGENRIVVRRAGDGERIKTLDGVGRSLDSSMTVIADAGRPVAVAGVIGDLATEVSENTTRILLECAYFDPATNRSTARRLGMFTEASRRFERGVDYGLMPYAVDRAARLIAGVSGGEVAVGVIDIYPEEIAPPSVTLRAGRVERLLGLALTDDEITELLESVDFNVSREQPGEFKVKVPTCRALDVTREADLIEELARLYGYNKIPVPDKMTVSHEGTGRGGHYWENLIRSRLAGMGFREAMTTTFTGSGKVEKIFGAGRFEPIKFLMPMSSDMDVLRPSLLVTLLDCVRHNINNRHRDLMLFEIGNVFAREPGQRDTGETRRLALAVTGRTSPVHWSGEAAEWDFFALKGVMEALFANLRLPLPEMKRGGDRILFEARRAEICMDGNQVGQIGLLDPGLARDLDLEEQDVFLLELDLAPLLGSTEMPSYRESSPYPGIRRDMSILVDLATPAGELMSEISSTSELVRDVTVFDLYEGEHVPEGMRSLALSVVFQSLERTLVDKEADKLFEEIFGRLVARFGIKPR
ncbi:MAG: phenylalanine--tRNA ligase subunit beta [Candidatus Glassbacteria bacterium]|nr:phenylalanine--tRNA ligase subunit beta [Candidatus Glassbacteria bacterium]